MRDETKTILVTEDDRLLQFTMRTQLQRLGCLTQIVDNGLDAVELAKKCAYPLMFLDVHMPGLSGLDVTRKLRKFESENSLTPLVIIGMTADYSIKDECLAVGMNECLMKPITLPDLEAAIAKYLQDTKG